MVFYPRILVLGMGMFQAAVAFLALVVKIVGYLGWSRSTATDPAVREAARATAALGAAAACESQSQKAEAGTPLPPLLLGCPTTHRPR